MFERLKKLARGWGIDYRVTTNQYSIRNNQFSIIAAKKLPDEY